MIMEYYRMLTWVLRELRRGNAVGGRRGVLVIVRVLHFINSK